MDVLECVDLLLRTDNASSIVFGSRARFEAIFASTAGSEDPAVQERAVALINLLGSLGHPEFRNIFRQATTNKTP
jgi:hypothetical protein